MTLRWRTREVKAEVSQTIAESMVEWLSGVEQDAKNSLYPGHGVDTGSMKRSIHAADDHYNWPADHEYPNGPERGGMVFKPTITEKAVIATIGSGQGYAIFSHQGAKGQIGLRFIIAPVLASVNRLHQILAAHSESRTSK